MAVDKNDAYIAVGTLEKTCSKMKMNMKFGGNKDALISVHEAANEIAGHANCDSKTWDKKRREVFNFSEKADKKLADTTVVSMKISGFLAREVGKV